MRLDVRDLISLTELRPDDRAACVHWLNDREIYERTLRIPHPYTDAHFTHWFSMVLKASQRHGGPAHFAVREGDALIGGLGFDDLVPGHRCELGYWLAKPWWGRGIMTAAVGKACAHAMAEWQLVRITAHVFTSNPASARVLEKNGFQCEGLLRKHFHKDGRFLDSRLFARVR